MEHSLREYIEFLDEKNLVIDYHLEEGLPEIKIKNISYNSKDDMSSGIFICKGAHFKQEYLKEALDRGAVCYISESKYDVGLKHSFIIVKDIRESMAVLALKFYDKVWEKLELIGITGTKGKSTTTFFVKRILDEFAKAQGGKESAVLSSIENYDGIIREESHLTTSETLELHRHFYNAVNSEIKFLTMEVSSQALKYKRTMGITFDVGAFLNIGIDHISDVEHEDFEDYFESKLKLIGQSKTVCINRDIEEFDKVLELSKGAEKTVTFGFEKDADIMAYNVVYSDTGITFMASSDTFDEEFEIGIPGYFNVENALCAIAVCSSLNIPLEYIKKGLAEAKVSGRMEPFSGKNSLGKEVNVLVDYAHNKLSFEALFESVKKQYGNKKITIIFGCPGKKAQGRRSELGSIAGIYADRVILTEEDPGEEDVYEICSEIAKYVGKKALCNIQTDRKKAIIDAIESAGNGDVILITGKGRETRQKRGMEYVSCQSDVDIVIEFFGRSN